MRFLRNILMWLAVTLLPMGSLYADELPFTDVLPWDTYHSAVRQLYEAGIITDTFDHVFRPHDTIDRDAFTALVLGASCQSCTLPTVDDIIRFRSDPFPDVTKANRYFYCISRSKVSDIVQGYMIDPNTGIAWCQDGVTSTRTLFCPSDRISRIEATAMLLREADLWDDTRNQDVPRTIAITDVSDYWYGYAKKGIETGLIHFWSGGKIYPDDSVTRWEFAIMAARTLRMNQCSPLEETLALTIDMEEDGGNYTFRGVTEDIWSAMYVWNFYNMATNESLTQSGKSLSSVTLGTGSWIITLTVTDSAGNTGTSTQNLSVWSGNSAITSSITVSNLTPFAGEWVVFDATITGGTPPYESYWNFSDGSQSIEKTVVHTFTTAWYYSVTYMVRDETGDTSVSKLVIHVLPFEDSDGDGIIDTDDRCPHVQWPSENAWCPLLPWDTAENPIGRTIDWYESAVDTLTSENICLANRVRGSSAILGTTSCASCPCEFTLDSMNPLEACDIILPVILSPDKNSLYSRGNTYQIQ